MKSKKGSALTALSLRRMQEIHRRLKSGARYSCTQLASEMEVSERTIMRDIAFLRDRFQAPIPPPPLPLGYYYEDLDWEFPSDIQLDEGEFFAFVVAQKVVQGMGADSPFARTLQTCLKKLSRHLAGRLPVRTEDLFHRGYDFDMGPLRQVAPEVLQEVDRALARKAPVDLVYHSLHRGLERNRRVVEPYVLRNFRGDWYLVGFCRKANALRTFALSRIESCQVISNQTFRPRSDFDPEKHFENSLGIFASGDPGPCRIWFSEEASRWILERKWHDSQRCERLEDGSIELTLDVGPTLEVIRWVLAHGADARPLSPPSLVEEVRRHVQAMSARLNEG